MPYYHVERGTEVHNDAKRNLTDVNGTDEVIMNWKDSCFSGVKKVEMQIAWQAGPQGSGRWTVCGKTAGNDTFN